MCRERTRVEKSSPQFGLHGQRCRINGIVHDETRSENVMSFTGDIVPGGETPSKNGSASTGVCVAIVGLGGLGAELLKRLIEARSWRGRPVTAVIAIDYFADAAAREAVSKSLSAVFSRSYVFSWDATKLQSTLDLEKDLTVALGTTTKVDALLITTGMGYHGSTRVTTLVQSDTALQKLLQVNCTGPSCSASYSHPNSCGRRQRAPTGQRCRRASSRPSSC
jgi:hypothetical protein